MRLYRCTRLMRWTIGSVSIPLCAMMLITAVVTGFSEVARDPVWIFFMALTGYMATQSLRVRVTVTGDVLTYHGYVRRTRIPRNEIVELTTNLQATTTMEFIIPFVRDILAVPQIIQANGTSTTLYGCAATIYDKTARSRLEQAAGLIDNPQD